MIRAVLFSLAVLAAPVPQAFAVTPVPAGNRNAEQPPVPGSAKRRTARTRSTFEKKYAKVRRLIERDRKLRSKIKNAAAAFGIDPIHIVGALVGEHTYNVDAYDRLQTYYVKAASYLGNSLSFEHAGVPVSDFVEAPEFRSCRAMRGNYALWSCRERIWDTTFRGKQVRGVAWPNDRFGRVFFQPLYAGQTFGLGQLNPLTALKVNDLVRAKSRRAKKLDASRAGDVYAAVMDPDVTLLTMAAVIRNAIDVYRARTGFDISGNPGLTATLYNLGRVEERAARLSAKNGKRRAAGQTLHLPQENYYGWLVNDRLADLRAALR